jgi:S-adenosyl-L-methionine hydrolase (adenosine-forming)
VCHGVIARLCPGARIIDITHGVPRHDVRTGALALRNAIEFMPAGVHMAVVDPSVGAAGDRGRRAVALRVARQERLFVGPDNGLLALAAARLGGVLEAADVGRSPRRLEPVSATFHGRDIFAPVAAALAGGEPLADVGEPLAVDELRELELSRPRLANGALFAHALAIDRFGNVILDAGHEELGWAGLRLGAALELTIAERTHNARYAATFADVGPGELLLYEDAQLMAALAVNRGSAADTLGLTLDDELVLRPVQGP